MNSFRKLCELQKKNELQTKLDFQALTQFFSMNIKIMEWKKNTNFCNWIVIMN